MANVPELRGRILASVDFTDSHGQGLDLDGHGTHVAGIIAASGRNVKDDTRGVAPGANIISLKVLDAQGKGRAATLSRRSTGPLSIARNTTSASSTCRWAGPCCSRGATIRSARRLSAPIARASSSSPPPGTSGRTDGGASGVRRRHRAGQLTVCDHRWRVEHEGHAVAERRRAGELQLEGSDAL